ncbi:inorganic diphosphatase [Patescibacteria group bacterium]|nr:inorganic diphosphatase [Patescibacteria group bacterium]
MNLWHDVPLGDDVPNEFNAIIEIPKGSYNKYEIDKETGLIALDRANYSASPYPFDYGFAPQTLWDDDDALDVIILTTFPLNLGILVRVRPVAVMEMIDSGESDFKIITVPVDDKRWDDVKDLSDLNKHSLKEFQHFFETYKTLKGKGDIVEVYGYKGKKEAKAAVEKSVKLYKEKFKKH